MKLRLLFKSKRGKTPKTFELKLPLVIGRGDKATFRIPHGRISRRHCELLEENGTVYVRDLGSTNGTMLKGTMLPSRTKTRVPSGSLLSLGGLIFRVEYQGSVAQPPVDAAEPIDFLEAEPEAELLEPALEAEPLESLVELELDTAAELEAESFESLVELEAEPISAAEADDFFLEPDDELPEAEADAEPLVELEADDAEELEAEADDERPSGQSADDDDIDDFLKDF
ncbi:MAG: FHA domain-containing protein [Planctomycetia bacterium]|jgi:predicted component of type VI protein secretion system|nr:FHA domain-containing protein [Planctomycetia bacterium]